MNRLSLGLMVAFVCAYPATGASLKDGWESVTTANNGAHKDAWQEMFAAVQRKHLHSITARPLRQGGQS